MEKSSPGSEILFSPGFIDKLVSLQFYRTRIEYFQEICNSRLLLCVIKTILLRKTLSLKEEKTSLELFNIDHFNLPYRFFSFLTKFEAKSLQESRKQNTTQSSSTIRKTSKSVGPLGN